MLGALRSNLSAPIWYDVTFQNSFVNVSNIEPTYQNVQYSLYQGKVEIRGSCYRTWPVPSNTVIFNLPVGFRPSKRSVIFSPSNWLNGVSTNFRIDVLPNGNVILVTLFTAGSDTCYVTFNVSFFLT